MFTYEWLPLGLFGVGLYLVIRTWEPPPYSWKPPPYTPEPWTPERAKRHAEWSEQTGRELVAALNKAVREEAEEFDSDDAIREVEEEADALFRPQADIART